MPADKARARSAGTPHPVTSTGQRSAALTWISRGAIVLGMALFALTLAVIDRDETWREARRLGALLPLVLLPSVLWHIVRTGGWLICFPPEHRPSFGRLFRVRLAADGVSYFTIRGLASEPLRVVLLMDRVPPEVSTASTILERTAMGVMSVVLVGGTSLAAMQSQAVPAPWQRVFSVIAAAAAIVLALTFFVITRKGRYIGPLFARLYRRTGWRWTEGRVVGFIYRVEQVFLHLARSDTRRLAHLALLAVVAYLLMAFEVWLVFRAIGEPVALWQAAIVETFTRSASVLGGAIPANLGALEAANVGVAIALGLSGAGSLALARRVRGVVWAALGLLCYPRDTLRRDSRGTRP